MRSSGGLVGLLATAAIILVLMVVLMKGSNGLFGQKATSPRQDHLGTTVLGQARYAAKDTVCQSDLAQVRESIMVYQSSNDDQAPASLRDLKLGAQFYECPVGHEPYSYDPATGKVHCVHPGHESY